MTGFLVFFCVLQERGLLYFLGSATCTTSFLSFYFTFDGFCFWGGIGYFPEFPKLLASCHVGFLEIRLRGVGKGRSYN